MSAWFENDVHANGVRLHVHRTGMPGKPALLLLHGITDSGPVWRRVARELAGEYDIVMPDARGHGQSDDLARGFSLSLLAADVVAVIESLGLQRPALWGHSMGAVTAAMVAAEHPRRVRAAILEDPPFLPAADRARLAAAPAATTPPPPDFRAMSIPERLAAARAMNPDWHPEELPPWAEAKAQVDPAVGEEHLRIVRDSPWRDILPRIVCPVLLLAGDPAAGARVTPKVAREATALLKQGRVVHIPGAGHNIHREAYETTMQAVRAFL